MRIGRVVSLIGKYTGLRYVTDLAMCFAASATSTFGFNLVTVDMERVAGWYCTRQNHLLICPECTWTVTPWPFTRAHRYCDEILSEQFGIAGPYSIAVAYCECGSPLTTKMLRRRTHVCELHMENLRPPSRLMRTWRWLRTQALAVKVELIDRVFTRDHI